MDNETVVETEEITEGSIEETSEDVIEESAEEVKPEKSKKSYAVLIYLAVMVIFTLLINNFYFSNKKLSKLAADDTVSVMYLDEEKTTSMVSFVAPYNRVTGIIVQGETDGEGQGLSVSLMDEGYNDIYEWTILPQDVSEDGEIYLPFDEVSLNRGNRYYLGASAEKKTSVGIKVGDSLNYGYGTIGFGDHNWVYQIEYETFSPIVLLFELIIILSGLVGIILFKKNTKDKVVLSLIYFFVSLVFLIITPMNTAFDEEGHFARAYEISEGNLMSQQSGNNMGTSWVPSSYIKGIRNVVKSLDDNGANFVYAREMDLIKHDIGEEGEYVGTSKQAFYSPVSYIPQSLGIFLGRMASDSVFLVYYYGRFAAFIVNIVLVILAFMLIPKKLFLLFAIACNPVFLTQMVSYSADGTLNALALFFVAYIMWLRDKEKISAKHSLIALAAGVILALSKVVYFPLVLLVFMIPDEKFNSASGAKLFKMFATVASFAAAAIWFVIARTYMYNNLVDGIRPVEQIKYLFTHFYLNLQLIFNSVYDGIAKWISQMNGSEIGAGYNMFSIIVWIPFAVILFVELFTRRGSDIEDIKISGKCRALIAVVLIVITGLIFAGLYVQRTGYQAEVINGIKGRYFIPLILPAALLVKRKTVDGSEDNRKLAEVMAILIAEICIIANTFQVYM